MRRPALLGIYRERVFSPGKMEDDAAIMDAALEELAGMGWEVAALPAESLTSSSPRPEYVLTMAQSDVALNILEDWCRQGTRAINSVSSIRSCYRKPLTRILSEAGIGIPPSRMVRLENVEAELSGYSRARFWLKRGDVHAMEAGDVVSVASKEELDGALVHFFGRDMRDILIQEHVEGPVVKFYGVGEGEYFRAYMAGNGDEVTSEVGLLGKIARQAAGAVGLGVYGGDAVLTDTSGPVLIDLNDWPSFSRCRCSAGRSIAAFARAELQGKGGLDSPMVIRTKYPEAARGERTIPASCSSR